MENIRQQLNIFWRFFVVERRENSDGQETAEKRKDKDSMGKRMVIRYPWVIDREIPIFKGEGRDYIEKLIDWEG